MASATRPNVPLQQPSGAEPHEDRSVRLGVFGGTFDPPHVGHVSIARELQESGAVDEILWIPVRFPPHKPANPLTSPEARMEMVRAATDGCAFQSVSDIELLREGPSYTVDTLRAALPGPAFAHPTRRHRQAAHARHSIPRSVAAGPK